MMEVIQWFVTEPRRILGGLMVFGIVTFIITWSICSIIETFKGK